MSMMLEPQVQWVTASPLWNAAMADPARIQRPAILRFASDTFMDDLAALLNRAPEQLGGLTARPESFRARPTGTGADWQAPPLDQLKLYQAVHGHFYLIAASLVCRMTGMPDRAVNAASGEKVSFILRRLGADGREMAWVNDPVNGKGWQVIALGARDTLVDYEELLPMFPVHFTLDDRRRRLFVGLIPTSSRDSFQAAPVTSPLITSPGDPALSQEADPRQQEVDSRVLGPLKQLVKPANAPNENLEQDASRFMLLDLADWLAANLPDVWNAIYRNTRPAGGAGQVIFDALGAVADNLSTLVWRDVLRTAWDERPRITGETNQPSTLTLNLRRTALDPDALADALDAALQATPSAALAVGAGVVNAPVPKLDPAAGSLYVLRCVYQRPKCGPLQPDLVSQPTEPFAIAPFFDFDAPARPIRISLPVDTSIAGLRKFNKNVAFLMSNKLRQQMECITDLKGVMDGNLACGVSLDLGTLCSFSIPIITICALIVLMIFLNLLNIVFWWLPFFRICFPISLKAKA
jgi:hypothetical protein